MLDDLTQRMMRAITGWRETGAISSTSVRRAA